MLKKAVYGGVAMESVIILIMAALEPLQALAMKLGAYVPSILASLLLLLAGVFIGRHVRRLLERLLTIIRTDEYSRKLGLSHLLQRLGMGSSLTRLIGIVVYMLIFIAFLLAASDVIGLSIVSVFLHEVMGFMPKLIAVVIVLGGGLFLGDLVGHITYRSASANHVKGAEALSKVAYGLLVIFSGFLALRILGIDISILNQSMKLIIGSIGLGCAIAFGVAFGMAGRDTAAKWIRDLEPKHDPLSRKASMRKRA